MSGGRGGESSGCGGVEVVAGPTADARVGGASVQLDRITIAVRRAQVHAGLPVVVAYVDPGLC